MRLGVSATVTDGKPSAEARYWANRPRRTQKRTPFALNLGVSQPSVEAPRTGADAHPQAPRPTSTTPRGERHVGPDSCPPPGNTWGQVADRRSGSEPRQEITKVTDIVISGPRRRRRGRTSTGVVSACRVEMTPEQRSLRGRMAAAIGHSRHDPRLTTLKAREAFLARFEREVDPDRHLPVHERERRARQARRAYFCRLALASSRARRR